MALIDGFLLHRVARPGRERADAEGLFEAMRALFIAYAMDEAEFERVAAADQPRLRRGGRARYLRRRLSRRRPPRQADARQR